MRPTQGTRCRYQTLNGPKLIFLERGKQMKKLAFALTALAALSLLAPTPGSAQQATLGLYLDNAATTYEQASVAPGLITVYLCMVDHDIAALYGYEYGFTVDGTAVVTTVTNQGNGPIDVGGNTVPNNHIVGLASPMSTTPVTVVAEISVFVMDGTVTYFTLHGAEPNSVPGSVTPALLLAGDQIVRAGVSGWDADLQEPTVCLSINEVDTVVATDEITLDGIKSLYR